MSQPDPTTAQMSLMTARFEVNAIIMTNRVTEFSILVSDLQSLQSCVVLFKMVCTGAAVVYVSDLIRSSYIAIQR